MNKSISFASTRIPDFKERIKEINLATEYIKNPRYSTDYIKKEENIFFCSRKEIKKYIKFK